MAKLRDFQIFRGLAANWTSANPTLLEGEFGYETDTKKLKIGDGTTAWTSLPYFVSDSVLNKYDATVAPTTTNDTTEGYSVGSVWINVTADVPYICVDATTSAAVWTDISGGGGSGTVTSVAQTVPTGLTVSGSPITGAGTLAISYDTGYQGFTTTESNKLADVSVDLFDVNQTTHGFSVGNAIKHNGTIFTKAQGTSTSTAGVIGVVSAVADVDNFTYQTQGLFTSGSWTNGTDYFLSVATAGLIATEPTYAAGNVRQFIGRGVPGGLLLNIAEGDEMVFEAIIIECSDQSTPLTTGTNKRTFWMPYAFSLLGVKANLIGVGSTSGTTTIDINEAGTSVLSTKLTIDFGEDTSETAATAAVISDSALANGAKITIDIDAVTGGANEYGLIVTLLGTHA